MLASTIAQYLTARIEVAYARIAGHLSAGASPSP